MSIPGVEISTALDALRHEGLAAPVILLTTTQGVGVCRTLPVADFHIKPAPQPVLLETVARVTTRQHSRAEPAAGRAAQTFAGWRVLVAEDNPINQQVISYCSRDGAFTS